MAQYRIHDPEELLECPYDKVHMVRAKRFQYHLMKCRKNYVGKDFSTCPFNAKHVMPKPEIRHHMATCPDKAMIEPELSYAERKASGQDLRLKGCTDTPVYNEMAIPSSEDWDTEVCPPVRVGPMHDPSYHSRVVFKDLSRMNKQQKAVMMDNRLTTEQKMAELKAHSRENTDPEVDEFDEDLRLPKTASATAIQPKPQAVQQPVSSVFAYSIGRGRGRGQPMPPQQEQRGADAFAPMFGQGMPLGVGRGMMGRGRAGIAPPPGFCVPNINQLNQN